MMSYRTPTEQAKHEAVLKAGLLAAAQAIREWDGLDTNELVRLLEKHAAGRQGVLVAALAAMMTVIEPSRPLVPEQAAGAAAVDVASGEPD
jgi:hypothetical protein